MPAIVDEQTFMAVQAFLQSRAQRRVPPQIVNGPILLAAGLAHCWHKSGSHQNTGKGKGSSYSYYYCSRRLKGGSLAFRGIRIG